jgi:GABA(A) receptor-associated protein
MNTSHQLLCKYPDRIPCIVNIGKTLMKKYKLKQLKFLTPCDMTLGQLAYIVRQRIKIDSVDAMFLFIDNKIPSVSKHMADIYDSYKAKDGFLYVVCDIEAAFG